MGKSGWLFKVDVWGEPPGYVDRNLERTIVCMLLWAHNYSTWVHGRSVQNICVYLFYYLFFIFQLAPLAVMLYYIPAYSFMSSVMDICLWLIWATLLIPDVHNRGHSGVPMISHVFGWPLLGSKSQKKWNCKILFSSVLSRICGSVKGQKTVLYYICTFKFNHNTGHISLHFLSFICLVVSQSNI